MPADVVRVLLGHRHVASTVQVLARLRQAGLASDQLARLGVLVGSRRTRLWTLTAAGRQFIASSAAQSSAAEQVLMRYGEMERCRDPVRQHDLPLLVACYRLLAAVASRLEQPVRVCAFEHPWLRTIGPMEGKPGRRVRVPAAAVLHGRQPDGEASVALLLVPDLGTAPLSSYRPMLQALIELRRTALTNTDVGGEPVLVVGVVAPPATSTARAQAWRSLVNGVARRANEQPLRTLVLEFATRPARLRDATATGSPA